MWLKSIMTWIEDKWTKFEAWIHSWFPGAKTKVVTGLGTVGMVAASVQEYITGLPLTKYITAETLSLVSAGLFTLSFWLRGLGDRVETRAKP